jgi:hypothetical protein
MLCQRVTALALRDGALSLSRLTPPRARAMIARKVTMYSAAWVRSQSRMASTSNQETWRVDEGSEGRVVLDVLRQVLTASTLSSFSLEDCVQSVLGETLEVLPPHVLATLTGHALAGAARPVEGGKDAMRVGRYAARRVGAIAALVDRLATATEALEMARACGLTLGQVGRLPKRKKIFLFPSFFYFRDFPFVFLFFSYTWHCYFCPPKNPIAYPTTFAFFSSLPLLPSHAYLTLLPQVAYNAQMIRTLSLLLRSARRGGYLLAGRQGGVALTEHTFIMHPVDEGSQKILWQCWEQAHKALPFPFFFFFQTPAAWILHL